MLRRGVDRVFFPGAALTDMAEWVRKKYQPRTTRSLRGNQRMEPGSDLTLARQLTAIQPGGPLPFHNGARAAPVVGITGPGGAGKTTLIDELVLRFLKSRSKGRVAILSHDPASPSQGALLADRASMVYAQNDRVFMRSLPAQGNNHGLAPSTRGCLALLAHAGFDLVLVESAGIGQETAPFSGGLVDKQVLVISPDYGGRLQLQKLVMLDLADMVVLNKGDLPNARTAVAEVQQRLALNGRGQKFAVTVARKHGDRGVDELFREVCP
jgi:methylmalonyl-CoA mutase